MKLWIHRVRSGIIAAFPALNAFVEEEEFDLKSVRGIFLERLTSFLSKLDRYIPSHDFKKAFNFATQPTVYQHNQLFKFIQKLNN